MNKIERQILDNQKAIITHLRNEDLGIDMQLFFESSLKKTNELLYPKDKEENACDIDEEEKEGCNCGFKVEEGKKGCGKVIDEQTDRAYRKGYNNALKELKQKLFAKDNICEHKERINITNNKDTRCLKCGEKFIETHEGGKK